MFRNFVICILSWVQHNKQSLHVFHFLFLNDCQRIQQKQILNVDQEIQNEADPKGILRNWILEKDTMLVVMETKWHENMDRSKDKYVTNVILKSKETRNSVLHNDFESKVSSRYRYTWSLSGNLFNFIE